MKFATTLLAAGAASVALLSAADAKQRPVWEIGVGGFGTYSPDYYGSDHSTFGGFPVVYFSYRGKDFSILSDGLFDVDADNESTFDLGVSIDFGGSVDSEDRLNLPEIDYVGEIGPEVTFALYANGSDRLEASIAARAAFEFSEGYTGFVVQPKVTYMTTLTSTMRAGISISPKFGFDGYNELYYSTPLTAATPLFVADDGYIGTDISVKYVNDVTDRLRLSGEVKAISLSGAKNEDSRLYREDWNFTVRFGLTYAIFQSDEMTDN
jgi:outer membrane scaffolding protein for murein synthesis (MipA/OmpV family)